MPGEKLKLSGVLALHALCRRLRNGDLVIWERMEGCGLVGGVVGGWVRFGYLRGGAELEEYVA